VQSLRKKSSKSKIIDFEFKSSICTKFQK